MIYRILSAQSSRGVGYAIMGALTMVVLIAGWLIGNALNTNLPSQLNSDLASSSRPTAGAVVSPPHQIQDFTLTSHTGKPISLSDLRGQAVLMFFGYTHCPDVCPTTLADYLRVKQLLGEDADEVEFVFISVDGQRDTPDVLTTYLSRFDPHFIGMTGAETALRQIGAEYGLMYQEEATTAGHEHQRHDLDNQNYFVQHTSPSFLIDRAGYLRMVYFYGTEPEVIAEGISQILG